MTRHLALLWLALALGSAPHAGAQSPLAAPVMEIRHQLDGGRIDEAIKAGERAVEALAQDSSAWLWLGRAYGRQAMQANMLSKARWAGKTRDAYERAVALDGSNLDARFDLMQYYVLAPGFLGGGRDKADAQALEIERRDPLSGHLARAYLAAQDKDAEKTERAYRDALAIDPAHPRARISFGMHLQQAERWEDAHALWQASLERDADDLLAHYQLARLAAVSGQRLEQGLVHIERYLTQQPLPKSDYMNPAAGHWRRGLILEKLGKREAALADYAEALRLQPDLEPARADLERLRDG